MEVKKKRIKGTVSRQSNFLPKKYNQRVLHDKVVIPSMHICIHISILKPQSRECEFIHSYNGTSTSQGNQL